MKLQTIFKWVVIGALLLSGQATTSSVANASQVPATGIINYETGMCLTVYGDQNGTPVVQAPCDSTLSDKQSWYEWFLDGDSAYRQVINIATGKCLEAPYNDQFTYDGTRMQIWDCLGVEQWNQLWITNPAGSFNNNYWQYINKGNGKCLNAPSQFRYTAGAEIQQWTCYGEAEIGQLWGNAYLTPPAPEAEYLIINVRSGKCLAVEGANMNAHAPVNQSSCYNQANQRWILASDHTIINVNSGLCLDIAGNVPDNHAKLQQFPCHARSNQHFIHHGREDNSAAIQLQVLYSWKCLDVPGGSLNDAVQIQQFDCHHGLNQLWLIIPAF